MNAHMEEIGGKKEKTKIELVSNEKIGVWV